MDAETFINEYCPKHGRYVESEQVHCKSTDDDMFVNIPDLFQREHVGMDAAVDTGDVVYLYTRGGEFVAWWDCENKWGYTMMP